MDALVFTVLVLGIYLPNIPRVFWHHLVLVGKCGSCGGSYFWFFHWLGTLLLQQLVATAQAMIGIFLLLLLFHAYKQW